MFLVQFGSLRGNLGERTFGGAGQCGHRFLALLCGVGNDGAVFQLHQIVGNARKLTLFSNEGDIPTSGDRRIGRNFAIAKTAGDFKHDGNAGSVIVRSFGKGTEFLKQSKHKQNSARNKAYPREHGEHQRSGAFRKHHPAQKHEHCRSNHSTKRTITQGA